MEIQPILTDTSFWFLKKRRQLILMLALAAWGMILVWPSGRLKVVFCDAGQGDETLIQRGFTQILIDGSRPGKALKCLQKHVPFFDRKLEMVILSHPQLDHFGGLIDVMKRYDVRSFVYNGTAGEGWEWGKFSRLVFSEGAKIETVKAGDEVRVGKLKFEVLWPKEDGLWVVGSGSRSKGEGESTQILGVRSPGLEELNSGSLVMALSYGDFDALFTGDIGEEEEKEMLTLGSVEVLKVAHHGSKNSSSSGFLNAFKPALAVIEVGKNSYGHPTAETLKRLREVGARIMRTDQDGDVVVRTDGKRWQVSAR